MIEGARGEVLVADPLDRLLIRASDLADTGRLLVGLRRSFPGFDFRRSAAGIAVSPQASEELFRNRFRLDLRWTPSAERYAMNRLKVRATHQCQLAELLRLKNEPPALVRRSIENSSLLDDHQVINVAAMTLPQGFGLCLFDEQGAGKTVTLIYAFDRLMEMDEIDFALIVAPKSMVPEWPADFRKFMGDLYKIEVAAGSRRSKMRTFQSGADVVVTNFETAVSMEAELEALLRGKEGRAILVVDESFYVKSLDALRTRALKRLREWCGRAFVLCGTPAPNAPADLVQQFNLVDFGLTFEDVVIPEDRTAAAPIVQGAMDAKGLYLRNLKSDVLPGLPDKLFHRIVVPLQPVQERLYRLALNKLISDLQAIDEAGFKNQLTSFFSRRAALLQLCSNPATVVENYRETPAKVIALDSLLEELIGRRGEKVVLWSFYTNSISAEVRRYQKYGAVRYDGAISDVDARRAVVRAFQEDPDTKLFVGNPAAAGAGLTLHSAKYAIYESMSNQAAHYLQSLDRIHRRGQERQVEYFVLLCDKTLEISEYDRLREKEATAQSLLRDKQLPPVSKESFLEEILNPAYLL